MPELVGGDRDKISVYTVFCPNVDTIFRSGVRPVDDIAPTQDVVVMLPPVTALFAVWKIPDNIIGWVIDPLSHPYIRVFDDLPLSHRERHIPVPDVRGLTSRKY